MDGNQLEVEVTYGAGVYRAFVEDVKAHVLEVSFENNWKAPCTIEFEKIRFPPDENADANFEPKQLVEVRGKEVRKETVTVTCWRKALLVEQDSQSGRWLLEFIINDKDDRFALVPVRKIRRINDNPTIGQSTLEKVEIKIPEHLRQVAATEGIHDDFRKRVSADSCKFVLETSVLRFISKDGAMTRMKVNLWINGHLKYLQSVVPVPEIPHINDKPTIGQSTLEEVEIKIPGHLRQVAATKGIHDDFRKHVFADSCKFVVETSVLRLMSRNGEMTRKKVDLLKVSHMNYLQSEKDRSSVPAESAKFVELIEVDQKLMGLALGKKYSNVREARKIKDIVGVDLIDGTQTIEIRGKTAQAVKTARNMLEYREHHTEMPRYLAEELLKDEGKIISEITEQSGLVRIECGEDDDDEESEEYTIVFVGNPLCIENAKALLEYQLKLIDRKLKKKQTAESKFSILDDPNIIVERIPMKKELKGLAVGKNSENLKKAQKIPGIVQIDAPERMPMITIYAQNEAAAQAARRLLEVDEDTVEVEPSSLGKIIGKGGVTIKKIESCSEGVRIRIPSKVNNSDLSSSGKVIIKVCGPAHKIPETIELIKKAEFWGHI